MYFGLTNSPATFCRAMQKMLRHCLNKYPDETGNYIDDMVVATKGNHQHHQQIVGELLNIFQENLYFLWPAKCEFEVSKIECLGLIVDGTTLSVDPKKADGLHNWPQTLSTVKEVRSVLGVLGYQWPFIPHYADIARPLTALTKKTVLLPGLQNVRLHLTHLSVQSQRDPHWHNPTWEDHSSYKSMHQLTLQVPFCLKRMTGENTEQSGSYQKHSMRQNATMTFMTGSY